MSTYNFIYGIDVSQSTLDIVVLPQNRHAQIANTEAGIGKWIKGLSKAERVLCVLEATGCYSNRLTNLLAQAGISFSVVSPSQSDGFVKAQGIISKNDKQAAHSLALMGQCLNLPLYQQSSQQMQNRKQLLMGINALKKQRQMLRNQLHALNNQILFAPSVKQALATTLHTVEQELKGLEEALNDLSDEEYEQQYDLVTSVVGIGQKTAQALLCATGGLQHFESAKQLAKFVGLVPSSHYSGMSVHKKGRITKKGNAQLRASLYMAARSAKKHNQACKDLYERLRGAGRNYKQAMVAVMHKLIKQVFGVFRSGLHFNNLHYLQFKAQS
ncbi:MAG: IS110 family transposase [Bacteroidota bacterium]